jgi:UDP-2-acetamido-3-amino-2,3-dideoxy-glucuronate N-acetyltransferase
MSTRDSQPSRSAWVHPLAEVEPGAVLGPGTHVWRFSHVAAGARVGADCVIGQNVAIGPGAVVGDRCKVQNNVSLYAGVVLEDGVFCGPSCVFTNVTTPRAEIDRKAEFRPTRVGRGATIGANATIVCGHELGAWCLIAAGAVVTHDVPAFALMAGVPARRIGWVGHAGEALGADLVCPRTGDRYAERPMGSQGGLHRVINRSGFGDDERPEQQSASVGG